MNTLVWAHRGASAYAPENTLEAFALAIEMNADGIELDIYLTSDGEIVVHHDHIINRTTCGASNAEISKTTLEELRKFDYSCGKEGYKNVKIPTLDEVMELIYPSTLKINIELKAGGDELCRKVIDCAARHNMTDRVMYSSFDHFMLKTLKDIQPTAIVAPLYSFNMLYPWKYGENMQAGALHPHLGQIYAIEGYIDRSHELGIKVNAWTVDGEGDMDRLAKLGVDGLITNKPDVALRVLGRG